MNFKDLFNTYTENFPTDERSNTFAGVESPPPGTLNTIRNFVNNYDSNEMLENPDAWQQQNESATEDSIEDIVSDTPEISEDVLSILSNLDTPADFMQNQSNNNSTEEAENNEQNDDSDPFENINSEIENLDDINEINDISDSDFFNNTEQAIDTTDDLDNDFFNDDFNTEQDTNSTNDLDNDSFNDDFNTEQDIDTADDLDNDSFNDDFNTEQDIDTADDLDNDSFNDDFNTEQDIDTTDDLDNDSFNDDFNTEQDIDTADDLDNDSFNDDFNTEQDINSTDDLDLSDFLGAFDNEDGDFDNPIDSDEDTFFEEEIDTPLLDNGSDDFDIELPEEFPTQEEAPTPSFSDNMLDLPDFSDTDLNSSENQVNNTLAEEFHTPTEYETVDKSINFDVWNNQSSEESLDTEEQADINEEQAFKIRYKINSLKNKDLRFKIRDIIANPKDFPEHYGQLISLLLIDAPEENIEEFLENIDDGNSAEGVQQFNSTQHTPSFLAHDVVDYQDTIYNIKNELIYNFKKYALYGIITILAGIIAWLGVAQPMRVNGIFEKGLTAIKNNQFVEGEALFQQANTIAGDPVAEWYLKYAEVYKDKNLVTEASSKYLSAIVIEPKNILISTSASSFYTNLGAKYFSNAINIMDNLSEFHPHKFEVWDSLGSLYIDYSDFFIDNRDKQTTVLYDAIDVYQEYIINNPEDPAPFYRMLEIYIRIGNKEQIDKIAVLLTELNPKTINIEMMTQLAKYYIDNKNLNKASRIFNRLTTILDDNFKDIRPLQKSMQNLYNIDPDRISNIMSESYFEFARYKMLSSDFRSAGIMLTNSILFNQNKEESYNLLGEAYLRSSEPTATKLGKAKILFDKVLEFNPNNYKAHINLGHMYYIWDSEFGGEIDKAHDNALYHYKLANSFMPPNVKNTLMSYNYGWLEYKNNNPNTAIDIWSEIYKNNPDNPILSYALGSALYQNNNPQLAQVILEKSAISLEALRKHIPHPDLNNRRHREVYTQLAKTYNNIGVIDANYGKANRNRQEYFESQALLNFYKAQDLANQINNIYSTTEYNIGVLTRPNIRNRNTIFDNDIPKQTSLENPISQFNQLLLEAI